MFVVGKADILTNGRWFAHIEGNLVSENLGQMKGTVA